MLSVLKFIPDNRSSNKAWEELHTDFFLKQRSL